MSYIRVKDQVFIRNTSRGDFLLRGSTVFSIDGTAQAVLELCDGTHTCEDIVQILADRFGESAEEVEKVVSTFMETLKEEDILITTETPSFITPVYDYTCPSSINIEITYRCNEFCIFCASNAGVPEENELTEAEIDTLLDEVISLRVQPVTITGGEPLLRKDLVLHMVQRVSQAGLKPNLLTNGTLLDASTARQLKDSGINFVQVSLDGACPETNDTLRRRKGGFMEAVRGIRALKEAGIDFSISTVLTKDNFSEMDAINQLGKELGALVSLAPVSPAGRGFNRELLLTPRQICESFCYTHETEDNEISMLAIPRERCSIGTSPVVTPTGEVYPCMLVKYEPLKLGNIRVSTLTEIWQNSPVLKELYQLTVHKLEPCKTCENKLFCGGGCRGHAFAYHGTVYKNDPYRCEATKLILKEILKRGDEKTRKEVMKLIM